MHPVGDCLPPLTKIWEICNSAKNFWNDTPELRNPDPQFHLLHPASLLHLHLCMLIPWLTSPLPPHHCLPLADWDLPRVKPHKKNKSPHDILKKNTSPHHITCTDDIHTLPEKRDPTSIPSLLHSPTPLRVTRLFLYKTRFLDCSLETRESPSHYLDHLMPNSQETAPTFLPHELSPARQEDSYHNPSSTHLAPTKPIQHCAKVHNMLSSHERPSAYPPYTTTRLHNNIFNYTATP